MQGCLLGTAVGDALGLPREGLRRGRAGRMFPGPIRHRLFFGRGMVSDDTDHCRMVAQCLHEAEGDVERFRLLFARRLKGWFLTLPAGIGLATVKACLRLLVGTPPSRSGVPSAGNGAAMRAAPIGVFFRHDEVRLRAFVEASARVTHTDERAIQGALAVALAAAASARGESETELASVLTHPAWFAPFDPGEGVSGYVVPTVHAALACWQAHPNDYRAAVTQAIEMGGDTDTVAAIVGGIVGARVGGMGIPAEWRGGVWEGPPFPLRNPLFLAVVLTHGFRRLLPPY
ncbi:MAG: ADP-ribosylglycohydrolase family protein [Fimbriimonas sp.]